MKAKQKKIILARDLVSLLTAKSSFLDRADIKVFVVATNDDLRDVHTRERANVIITTLDMPGVRAETLFTDFRAHETLRDFSVIIVIKDTLVLRERCKKCKANAVFTVPVDEALLSLKVNQFINVAPRKSYRASLAVGIQGKFRDKPQPFWTENISSRGMLIRTGEPLAKGEGIFFSFFLPDGTHVSGYGEISRVDIDRTVADMHLYGIRFTNIEPADVAAIEAFIG
ncbi:MAG TPA: PilZ domain-containing protein [Nitrospirota bacterium]